MSERPLALVPMPRFYSPMPGHIRLGAGTYVQASDDPLLAPVVRRLCDRLSRRLGSPVTTNEHTQATGRDIQLVLDSSTVAGETPTTPDNERYTLTVDDHGIVLLAATVDGLRHATTTLLALVETAPGIHGTGPGPVDLPSLQVSDAPRFGWRGLALDVARHFLDVEAVCTILELMADLRLNRLHLHLTDDQNWRLKLTSRPLLTEHSGAPDTSGGPDEHYTAADLAHIQSVASDLGIVVIPEIGLPSHSSAATYAYRDLNPSGSPSEDHSGTGDGFDVLHAELLNAITFVHDVLGETASMTHGPWLHLGGDETLRLSRTDHDRLVTTALEVITRAGKTAIGCQGIARADLPPGTVVQFWDDRPDAGTPATAVVEAAHRGAHVLLSPTGRTHLSAKHGSPGAVGQDQPDRTSLRHPYEWEPDDVLGGLPRGALLGIEACLWTEDVHTFGEITALLLPRLAALAEVAWSAPQTRDWESFRARLTPFARRWTAAGVPWTRHPDGAWPDTPFEQSSAPAPG